MSQSTIPLPETKILFGDSANTCAFPGCGKRLVEPGTDEDDATVLGEMAHIVADSRQGPRGNHAMTDEDRNKHPNLILLCRNHHKVIDSQTNTYSVAVLRQMKADHERHVRKALWPDLAAPKPKHVVENIHSAMLPVTHLPEAVFSAPCKYRDRQEELVRQRMAYPEDRSQIVRFILRDEKLYTFHNLNDPRGPFSKVVDRRCIEPHRAIDMWKDAEGKRRYVTLLNRALYRYTTNFGIRYDPAHYRFYFPATHDGKEREVEYRPLNTKTARRMVAWQPKRKATGEVRNFWWHLGAGLRFDQMADLQWVLSIRPERHLTSDGKTPLPPKEIGRRVTSKKARMWNDIYLGEVNFWRDFLSGRDWHTGGSPRIVLNFGDQSAVIGTQFLTFDVDWPGIPGDEKAFKNQTYEDDLFSQANFAHATGGASMEWDEEDEHTDE